MSKRASTLGIAILLGLVAVGLGYLYLSKQKAQMNADATVVVASKPIVAGTSITQDMLKMQSMPRTSVPPGTVIDLNFAIDQVARADIRQSQPITVENITPKNRLALIIPPFMRAVTVAVDPVVGVAGFLKAGDHVDVVSTFSLGDATVTRTVLQDVLLLAAGPELTPNPDKANEQKPQLNATLAVMPADAERLVLSDVKGKLRLTLRRPDDTSFVRPRGTNGHEVMGSAPVDNPRLSPQAAARVVKVAAQIAPRSSTPLWNQGPMPFTMTPGGYKTGVTVSNAKTIQVIRGAKVEEVEVPR